MFWGPEEKVSGEPLPVRAADFCREEKPGGLWWAAGS